MRILQINFDNKTSMEVKNRIQKSVHLSKSMKITTVIFLSLLVACEIAILIIANSYVNSTFDRIVCVLLFLIILFTLLLSIALAPKSITLTDNYLKLKRGVGKIVINYTEIEEAEVYNDVNTFELRVCGIGGVFGNIGRFYNKKIGRYFSYVADYKQSFYIKLKNGKKYVFSCVDNDYVVFIIRKKMMSNRVQP